MSDWTVEKLEAFSQRAAAAFSDKKIHSPIHLCSTGQAQPLIDIFADIRPQDWIFCSWRNSYHCLLKGMPEEELFRHILEGRSMFVMSDKYRIISSAIVGGVLPIAVGVALGIKRNGGDEKCFVFMGDMTASTGIAQEFFQYAYLNSLPVKWIVEDNGYSTGTPTSAAWGNDGFKPDIIPMGGYHYERTWPHCGIHQHVSF